MLRHLSSWAVAAVILLGIANHPCFGRGFGGRRGGAFHGGGFHGGGFHGGAFHGSNIRPSAIRATPARAQPIYTSRTPGYHAGAVGGYPAVRRGRFGSGVVQYNQYIRFPTDAGMHSVPRPVARSAAAVSAGTVGVGLGSVTDQPSPSTITFRETPEAERSRAAAVRRSLQNLQLFTPAWYKAHPTAWRADKMSGGPWTFATWAGVDRWLSIPDDGPVEYDYGGSIVYKTVYKGTDVYIQGQRAASARDYAQAALDLAQQGGQADDQRARWLSLGVFALVDRNHKDANSVVQLSVSSGGLIRGVHFSTETKQVLVVRGAVDKYHQRAAWSVGDKELIVADMGLYNITQETTPILIHTGWDHAEQWLMVRLKPPQHGGEKR